MDPTLSSRALNPPLFPWQESSPTPPALHSVVPTQATTFQIIPSISFEGEKHQTLSTLCCRGPG